MRLGGRRGGDLACESSVLRAQCLALQTFIAIYAAVVATGVLLWDAYTWRRTERVRLVGRVMTNAIAVGGYSPTDRSTKYVSLTVDNRGHLGCTITHFSVVQYQNWLS